MAIDRRSFRLGALAGLLVVAGIVIGTIVSARMDWIPVVHGNTAVAASAGRLVALTVPSQNFADVVKAVTPAVVNISTTRVLKSAGMEELGPRFDDPFFRRFFGDEFFRRFGVPRERRQSSLGSGVIVDPSGYIVTNNHVIANADEIKVVLRDKREFNGKVIGTDPKTDLAVIRIDGNDLPTVTWGNSDALEVGEYVLAIGNPFGLNQTVTMGIVSAVGRANVGIADYEDFIQTDAAINPGNSGGAMVNVSGELVGINTAIFSRSGGYMGIGFAVPSNMVRSVMDSLIEKGKVIRGWLGVSIQGVTADLAKNFGLSDAKGALVSEVLSGSPASKAGIKSGDVIIGFDGKEVEDQTALRNIVARTPVGKRVKVRVIRDKRSKTINVLIGEQPKDLASVGEESEETQTEGDNTALAGLELRNLTPDIAGRLGLPPDTKGVVITDVDPESSAAQAGLRTGDLITEINREPVRDLDDYKRIIAKLGQDDDPLLLVRRRDGKFFVIIKS
ncbi:MAG: DegQ family serine endoprotease [Acidiferrobacterales bacterium]